MRVKFALLLPIISIMMNLPAQSAAPEVSAITSWRELGASQALGRAAGVDYFTFPLANGTKAHLVVIKPGAARIFPVVSDKTRPVPDIAAESGAVAAINGGYFNLSDGVSASYMVREGKEILDPTTNRALVSNPKLQPHLQKIFDRSEIRFLRPGNKAGAETIEIAAHSSSVPANKRLIDSLQAGPRLLPRLTSEEEAFVRKEPDGSTSDSIGTAKLAARTAFGITKDGYAMMLTVAGKAQEDGSSGLTLVQLADVMKHLGCVNAINLDGGASTTMYVQKTGAATGTMVCGKATRVKTVLMVKEL